MPPSDDPSVADGTKLHRGVAQEHVVRDQNQHRLRPSSAAFNHYEMSIVLDDTLTASGRTPADALERLPQEFLAFLRAGLVREHGQVVIRSESESEPAHGDVIGHKTGAIKRKFARSADWEIPPPDEVDA